MVFINHLNNSILKPFEKKLEMINPLRDDLNESLKSKCAETQQKTRYVCETPYTRKYIISEKARFIWVLILRVKNLTLTFDK